MDEIVKRINKYLDNLEEQRKMDEMIDSQHDPSYYETDDIL